MKWLVIGIGLYVAYQVLYCKNNPAGPFCLPFPSQSTSSGGSFGL